MDKFYITTPLYYVNDKLHLGHAYCTVSADVIARFYRMLGRKVFFLTGTDEHGQKVAQIAEHKHLNPQQWADRIVEEDKRLWKILNISYNEFIRTTEKRHTDVVQFVFEYLYKKNDIYKSHYEGWYCTSCETFYLDNQIQQGVCPQCSSTVEKVKEESYFFKLSSYQDKLLYYFDSHPEFLQPDFRRQEIINFVKQGLKDISISRTTVKWAIPVPFDSSHTIYVWFDALLNYISAIGYLEDKDKFNTLWPADLHLVGKEIFRFHTVIWPAMLIALDLPLPKKVFAHGWWTVEGEKMSKSKGNVIDPIKICEDWGVDVFRYFILKEVPLGLDGDFSQQNLKNRYNAELANDLGNLLSRALTMVEKYVNGYIPKANSLKKDDIEIKEFSFKLEKQIPLLFDKLEITNVLNLIWEFIYLVNKYIEKNSPWNLAKNNTTRLFTVLYNTLEAIRIIGIYLCPFMPITSQEILKQLGLNEDIDSINSIHFTWGQLKSNTKIRKGPSLFPRKR